MLYNKLRPTFLTYLSIIVLLFLSSLVVYAEGDGDDNLRYRLDMFEHYRTLDYDKAVEYAEQIVAIQDLPHTAAVADVFGFLATHSEMVQHKYLRATSLSESALLIYDSIGDSAAVLKTKANLSRLYLRNGNYHKAYSHAVEVLDAAQECGDETSLREVYLVLEQVTYYYHSDIDMAMGYNHHVSEGYVGRVQAHQTVRALNNLFLYAQSQEAVDTIFERSVALCNEYGFVDQLVNIYLNMAMYELQQADTEAAARYLDEAKAVVSNFKEEGYYHAALGFFYLNIGDPQQAIKDLNRSVELLEGPDFDSKNVHSYFVLQEVYYNEGRYAEAYNALMAFAEIYTRQNSASDVVELSMLINDLEMERAAKERRLLEEQHELEQRHAADERRSLEEQHILEQKHGRMGLYFSIFLIFVFIGVGVLIYSRYRLERKNRHLQRLQAEQDINYKNEIIKIQRLQQYQEQNYRDKLSEELTKVVNMSDAREMRTELLRVIRQLRQNSSSDDWAEVETTLVGMNDSFFDNLLKEYPNLTKNERKLCTLIHMNLSTKEIANITHQSAGSINVARSRLRQKFGLTDSDISLIAFLDKFK